MRVRVVAPLVALGLSCAILAAQGPQQPPPPPPPPQDAPRTEGQPGPPIFRTGINLVRVDVTATGRGDKAVEDLTAADFELREDGVPQTIEQFQFVRLTGEAGPGDDSLPIRSQHHGEAEVARDDVRVFCLFLDDYHISEDIATTQRLRQSLTEWLENGLKPTDILILMDPLTPISALEYTRDPAPILEKVKKFKGRRGIYMPVRSALEEGQLQTRNPARIRAEVTLTALNAIVTHLGSLRERRTSVIFVSEGMRLMFSDADIDDRMRDVLEAANRFNVTVNVLDPRGLTGGSPADVLWRLSGETGGRAIVNTNGLADGLAQVVDDASAYYLLGYTPSRQTDDGKFHKIEVKSLRKGVRVLARKGYWAPSEKEKDVPTAPVAPPAVTEALNVFSRTEGGQRAMTWLGFEPGPARSTRVSLSWLPRRTEPASAAPTVLKITAEPAVGGDALVKDQVVQLGADPSGAASPGGTTFDARPGGIKLTLQLEDKAGEVVDRWTEKVDVPAFGSDAALLATPRLLLARSFPAYRQLAAAPDAAVPTPQREFRRTDRVLVRVGLAGPSGEPVEAILLNRDGKELVKLKVTADGEKPALQTELPLANLAAGDYVVKFVRSGSGDAPAAPAPQHVAFRVVP